MNEGVKMKEKFYITTAIAYTSKIPHIGNTYEWILSDAVARYKRNRGYDVYFLTGTDEHGEKIEQEAKKEGKSAQEHVDLIAKEIQDIDDKLGVSYDQFIRTTDKKHKEIVQKIFRKIYEKGDIYKGFYEGLYCVPCESFFMESQLADGMCPDCGREVVSTKEDAYFFKLSKYQKRLEDHIEANPDFIVPPSRKNEMLNNFIRPGLRDLCVSRSSFSWGIPVDFDEGHVVYVWIDALSNYITALGYDPFGESDELFTKNWPADLHIIGKDIVRFHTIYWPIILMSLDLPLPKQVYGHPWLLSDSGKMSKSKGNTLYARDLVKTFGLDRVRYSVLREMPYSEDGHFSPETLVRRSNSDLSNVLGNLLNRTLAMSHKYFGGQVKLGSPYEEIDLRLQEEVKKTLALYEKKMDSLHISEAMASVIQLAKAGNKYIDDTTPWLLAKDETKKDRLSTVLYSLIENLRIIAILLEPFIPETSEEILNQIRTQIRDYDSIYTYGSLEEDLIVGKAQPIFERLDLDEIVEKEEAAEKEKVQVKEEAAFKTKEEIDFQTWEKLDLRVAKIISVEDHPQADRLYVLKVDLGQDQRQVVSGIKENYTKEELLGKTVVLLVNLKPIKLRGVLSQGMLLAESKGKDVRLLEASLKVGSPIS
ncbi:MAG TPA: methionine--tRNA ligase [Clostridia bacterium]|nr:methionine--tRNA ligase [Clostridia bacterium]